MSSPSVLVVFAPSGKRGRFPVGTKVLDAARALGADLDSVCGGRGICSKCQVAPQFGDFPKYGVSAGPGCLSAWNAVEERYKSKRGMLEGRRLGCQAQLMDDALIDVPPESQLHRQVVRKDLDARPIETDPATRLVYVEIEEPDMDNPRGDRERLLDALKAQTGLADIEMPFSVLRRLQPILRKGKFAVTAAVCASREDGPGHVLEVWPGFHDESPLGLAYDVGSTTIACHLVDLDSGRGLASKGAMNPQIRYGEDLMSRVSYSMMNPGGAEAMTAAVREALNSLKAEVCAAAEVSPERIFEAVLVGNPVMHHLLLGIDPIELGGAPFALAAGAALEGAASEIGLTIHPEGRFYTLPCIAGHVGADCAAAILSEAPQEDEGPTLLIDVGTNAEIVLGDRKGLLACSSPTGPAFEGAQISCGQRAAPGAIERVRIDPVTKAPRFKVIGSDLWSDDPAFDARVTGVAGSGIIEAIAEMRLAGVIDADGAIDGALAAETPRVVPEGRTFSYVLHETSERRLMVTQNDVRAIQLAKAALDAGVRLLMREAGVESVARVKLAGAFGAHISPLHAMILGMIPDCPLESVKAVGNAAGEGARLALVNRGKRREIERLASDVKKIETAIAPGFQALFVDAIAIPHKTAVFPNLATHVTLPVKAPRETPEGEGGRRRRRRE